jgi:hypothetical protein
MAWIASFSWGNVVFAGQTQAFGCPESIAESSVKLTGIDSEWTPFITRPLYLHAAAPIDGPPQRRGDLAEFTEQKVKDGTIVKYRFEGNYPDGKWLQCLYGEYGQVTLSKRIDDRFMTCEFYFRKGAKAAQNDIRIECR